MDQIELFDIPSPCIAVCKTGDSGYCLGCYRSREERLYWLQTTPYAKRVIIKACQRRKKLAQRKAKTIKDPAPLAKQDSLFPDLD
ncbi:DUF1289 domain-containing protein [Aliiglaciecola sp. LCG003]|uniref:DUF1289 domain-containing protein n=1 Tax=Aliiglaciecola sp. LCG003 TaxID=3053655 RepID=UPI002572D789|nr:DUF1289 domain-containing protein [Aliiglaciecola sp. LCG003]WJG10210.1 DUF1289 domain-containing protein [Aliiglaciecola sp. LCG003]